MKKLTKMKNKTPRILFIYRSWRSFVKRDYDILKKHFDVEPLQWRGKRDIIKMIARVLRSDVIFSWFAGNHAGIAGILATIFGKKSIVVVGGVDVANVPEIEYGLWYKGSLVDKFLCKYAISHADFALPVSEFNEKEMLKRAKPKKHKIIYNGIPSNFCEGDIFEKRKRVATIGILQKDNLKRKGLYTYIEVAKYFPDLEFLIIGKPIDNTINFLKNQQVENLKVLGFLSHKELVNTLKSSIIYAQLSAYESFGVAVVEAMQCGCVPVVTNRGALPEVVGDVGVVVEYGNLNNTIEGIKKALKLSESEEFIKKVRERGKFFSLDKREKKLVEIINKVLYK